eukprot:SAG11_NODE_20066_length_453_cov_1.161017_1_plen_108_part_10
MGSVLLSRPKKSAVGYAFTDQRLRKHCSKSNTIQAIWGFCCDQLVSTSRQGHDKDGPAELHILFVMLAVELGEPHAWCRARAGAGASAWACAVQFYRRCMPMRLELLC